MPAEKAKSIELLSKLTSKKHIFFTDRGNSSILLALKLAKSLGKKRAFMQDQGGWITYYQFIKKLKLELEQFETDYGIIDIEKIKDKIDPDSLLLINSMPGYYAIQKDMDTIEKICSKKKCLLINDASGSIGTNAAKYGDIILGSFGEWKPVELKYGGFIAFDDSAYEKFFKDNFTKEVKDFYKELNLKLSSLNTRLKRIDEAVKKIKAQLVDFDIIHKDNDGLNVIAKFNSEGEKMKILDFCKIYNYEFTLCPRYIRVLEDAVSIEVKRLD